MTDPDPQQIHEAVRQHYGQIAEVLSPAAGTAESCCGPADCCDPATDLYEMDLASLPADVTNLALGCGDPVALAQLMPGQTVLDLGSGGGIDCFLAARQVGESGHVIGVDMTPAMIQRANSNLAKMNLNNVEFRFGQIEKLPVESDSIDVILSNCVINLSPDKAAVFREAYRVLRPGGSLAVSDIVTQGKFSPAERADLAAWSGCITGAEDVADYVAAIQAAGFREITVRDKNAPQVELTGTLALYVGRPRLFSASVTAVKP